MNRIATTLIFAAILHTTCFAQSWRRESGRNDNEGIFSRTIIHPDGTRTMDKRDLQNKLLEKKTLDRNDVLLMRSLFELNPSGKPTNGLVYDGRNQLLYRSEFVYDGNDELREERIFEPGGTPVRRLIYKKDPRTGEMRPAFAHTYIGGKEVASGEGDYQRYSTNSSHAYRGGASGSGVAATPSAYQRPTQTEQSRQTTSKSTKRERRFRLFKRR